MVLKMALLILTTTVFVCTGNLSADTAKPDNTQVNKRDLSDHEVTAEQQSNKKSDIEITRTIRQNIFTDKNLSTYGHNVKIITDKGKVILKGPVRSEQERDEIQLKAQLIAGAENVQNQMEVVKKNEESSRSRRGIS